MTEIQQVEQIQYPESNYGEPASSVKRGLGASLLAIAQKLKPKRIRDRRTTVRKYHVGMTTLAGELLSWRPAEKGARNRNPIATIKCSKCGKEKDLRMDSYLHRNESCGCGAEKNKDRIIEKTIKTFRPHELDSIAACLEVGQLDCKQADGTYDATDAQIAKYFGARWYGKWIPFALSRIRRRWTVATWQRLGAACMERTAKLVAKFGRRAVAHKFFDGMIATVKVALRWISSGRPDILTLQAA